MIKHVCIFEDQHALGLSPLTYARPLYALRLGIDRLFDKVNRYFESAVISLHCRDYFKSTVQFQFKDQYVNQINLGSPCLFINGRVAMTQELANLLQAVDLSENTLFIQHDTVIAAYLTGEVLESMVYILEGVPSSEDLMTQLRPLCRTRDISQAVIIATLWDGIVLTPSFISYDFDFYNQPGVIKGDIKPYSVIYNENQVFIDEGVHIEDFVVIDAQKGPVYIESGVTIQAHSRLEGPLFIGKDTQILGGKIKESSIGPLCKIAGEISHSIFQGYSNKAHDGFIGHSYIGEWVNLGAFTSTSNLKNTYSPISLSGPEGPIPTGQQFLGSILGDFVKTGIYTTFNTGSIVHFGSTLFNPGFHDTYIPPFSWGSPGNYSQHDLDKFMDTSSKVLARRNLVFPDVYKSLYATLFQHYA